MNKSNLIEMEEEIGNQVQLFIWRIPKKNHDEMVRLQMRFDTFLSNMEFFARTLTTVQPIRSTARKR